MFWCRDDSFAEDIDGVMKSTADTGPWASLFDRIVVVSLGRSTDRRGHAVAHLRECGLPRFEFFDATPEDDPAVAQACGAGDVRMYPPCFRCGQLDCGKPDCNNFLIPAQIATFITYRRLWRDIAAGTAERVLVLEDDVAVHAYAPRVLMRLAREISAGRVPFVAGARCLLRLGWALGKEHRGDEPFRVREDVRMSNPCHALTRSYAQALIDRDRGIVHTADVYQHQLAPRPGEAWTVFPPLASDMSWSVGSFDSTIHPKAVRSTWLRAHGDGVAAKKNEERVARHVKKKQFRPLLVIGPVGDVVHRVVDAFRRCGVDVGRERLGTAGVASWALAVEADHNPDARDEWALSRRALAWQWMLLGVSDIAPTVATVMHDSTASGASYAFRRDQVDRLLGIDLDAIRTPLARAVWSVTSWCRIVLDQAPASVWRVEDGDAPVREFLAGRGLLPDAASVVPHEAMAGEAWSPAVPLPTAADWAALDDRTLQEVRWYADRFGYTLPTGLGG